MAYTERQLLRLADRISQGFLEDKRPEFCKILDELAELGYDISKYYIPVGSNTNKLIVPGVPKSHFTSFFETFEVTKDNEQAFESCQKYADVFAVMFSKGMNISMIGSNGTGKTHLAASICRVLSKKTAQIREDMSLYRELDDYDAKYYDLFKGTRPFKFVNFNRWLADAQQSMDRLINGDDDRPKRPEELAQELAEFHGLLIIDELFATKDTDFCAGLFQRIASWRYDHNLPMLVITNRTADELYNIDSTMADRVLNKRTTIILTMTGESYRAK